MVLRVAIAKFPQGHRVTVDKINNRQIFRGYELELICTICSAEVLVGLILCFSSSPRDI